MTRPRRRTVAAVIAAAVAIGVGAAAFALGSQSAASGTRRVKTSDGVGPTTTEAADGPLVSLVPVPSGPAPAPAPAATNAPAQAGGPAPPTCSSRQVGLSVTTDRASYRPGDTVVVTALLRNASALPCAAPLVGADGTCQPQVVLSISPGAGIPDVRLGPYAGACTAPTLLVAARSSASAVIQAPFRLDPGAAVGYLPAGTWKVAVAWPGLAGTISAQTTLRCDLTACSAPVVATTLPKLAPTTVQPVTSTTTTSSSTTTSAPANFTSTTLAKQPTP